MAQAFIRLRAGWINQWLGKVPPPQRDLRTANVKVHLSSTSDAKKGRSIGAALTGECLCDQTRHSMGLDFSVLPACLAVSVCALSSPPAC